MADKPVLDKVYDPRSVEPDIYRRWEESGAFRARPDTDGPSFTIVIPPPNVTGALHLGHALNNTLQDILIRYHRMRGFNTLWQPGTDHAGIATQAVVERRIREQEGKTRHELGREELVRRIWQWKDEYEKRILDQLRLMGCSCDWERTRFTLDEGLSRAVRRMFFNLFREGLIFRGKRLVNWDTQLQTAVSDDEVYYETVKGHFWYFRYPIIPSEPRAPVLDASDSECHGSARANAQGPSASTKSENDPATEANARPADAPHDPEFVLIATTRPETMLGDTAVAVHPDPEGYFARREAELKAMWDRFSSRSSPAGDRADSSSQSLPSQAGLSVHSSREAKEIQARVDALAERRRTHLPLLIRLRDMARAGRKVRLPLVERELPLICDEWADPTLGTGCVKITPAHDPNDYEVGLRHNLPLINVLTPDGKVAPIIEPDPAAAPCKPGTNENTSSDRYAGLPFSGEGRARVVADMEECGLVEAVEDRDIEIGHSDRSKLPIEPFLSDQWFVRTGEERGIEGSTDQGIEERAASELPEGGHGVRLPDGTVVAGLAQAAIDVVQDGRIQVFPPRYAKSYRDWLAEKRDWCISRQLWWGHQIPVWHLTFTPFEWFDAQMPVGYSQDERAEAEVTSLRHLFDVCGHGRDVHFRKADTRSPSAYAWYLCTNRADKVIARLLKLREDAGTVRSDDAERIENIYQPFAEEFGEDAVAAATALLTKPKGMHRDPDVLDTWFSSALWPFSTLGWPDETPELNRYYPTTVLCTSRDIITNWVARMVMFGLYATGNIPFHHVYIHPKILDGRGETMSKSKGNGVDPVDIIHTHGADALRYSMADMTTETQDIRMPVEYVCPHCGALVDQQAALKQESQRRKSRGEKLADKLQPSDCTQVICTSNQCGREFATQWADAALKEKLGVGRETSDKFDIGRNFCNKLWNAARFAFMNLDTSSDARSRRAGTARADQPTEEDMARPGPAPLPASLPPEDRWILALLSRTIRRYHECIAAYQFSVSVKELREFFWDSLCDWYIELTKPRLSGEKGEHEQQTAQQVLAFCLDQVLRLWHPTIPFITERLWQQLNAICPQRGLPGLIDLNTDCDLIVAPFPPEDGYPELDDERMIDTFAALQDATRAVRDLRAQSGVSPKERVTVTVVVSPEYADSFRAQAHIVRHMAHIGELHVTTRPGRPKNAATMAVRNLRIYVHDISDDEAERKRTLKALQDLERQITGKEKKLANEKFVTNADPEVVEAERQRLTELTTRRAALQDHLAELGDDNA